jgi:histidinol-phosphate aminotransferase
MSTTTQPTALVYGPSYVRHLQPYLAGRPISAVAREFSLEESEIVKLASNENPLGMPAGARRAIEALAAAGSALYPDPDAHALKTAIGEALQVPRGWITVGNGSTELVEMAIRALVERGQSVVLSQYSFCLYQLAATSAGARTIVVPAADFGHDLEAMLRAIEPDTRIVFVANPNNPTGTFHEPERIREFLDRVPERVVVVLDEAYTEYLPEQQQTRVAELVARHANLIVVRTFSKAYALAALRIGFAVAQEQLSGLLNRVRQAFNTSAFAQAAATAAIADREFVARSRTVNSAGLAQLYPGLDRLRLPYLRSSGNFVLVRVGDGGRVFTRLLREGVIVRPVENYGLPEWLRVSVGTREQNARLLRALGAICSHRDRSDPVVA